MQNNVWLLTNGLGSFSMGSVDESICHSDYALFTALLRPPLRREKCVRRMYETVYLDNRWQPLIAANKHAGASCFRAKFSLVNNLPCYEYTNDQIILNKRLFMEPGADALYFQYEVVRSEAKCRLRIQPLLTLPESFFETNFIDSPLHVMEN
ncbi:MAG: glycogen debranching enzyme N-terminal domain-containing protein, partial [bacterium]